MLGPTIEYQEIIGAPGILSVYDEGASQGNATTINCSGGGITCGQSGTTTTITIAASATAVYPTKIIVGTTAVYGANIVSTMTTGWRMAISSFGAAASSSGTIYVQAGIYGWDGTIVEIPTNITLQFDKGAWFTWDNASYSYGQIMAVSGTVTGFNADITTSIVVGGQKPLIHLCQDGRLLNSEIKLKLSGGAIASITELLLMYDNRAKNAVVDNLRVSSYTLMSLSGSDQSVWLFSVRGATNCALRNVQLEGNYTGGGAQSTRKVFSIFSCDGFDFSGGYMKVADGHIVASDNAASGDFIRGFRWSNMNLEINKNPSGNGSMFLNNVGGVNFSSGNVVSNLQVFYKNASNAPFMVTNGVVSGWSFLANNIYHDAPGTGGGFSVAASARKLIFIGNQINGTSGCMADSGSGTKWTGNDNFCQGDEQ